MKAQEIFNKAYLGVIKQGKPAYNLDAAGVAACVYRADSGDMCAFGHVMKDIVPFESSLWQNDDTADELYYSSCDSGNDYLSFMENGNIRQLAMIIQRAHDADSSEYDKNKDSEFYIARYKNRMAEIAIRFSLTLPEVV